MTEPINRDLLAAYLRENAQAAEAKVTRHNQAGNTHMAAQELGSKLALVKLAEEFGIEVLNDENGKDKV